MPIYLGLCRAEDLGPGHQAAACPHRPATSITAITVSLGPARHRHDPQPAASFAIRRVPSGWGSKFIAEELVQPR